ncbi:MAG: hypothetical protein ACRDT6_28045 [Micromonosporaceae bacterium]
MRKLISVVAALVMVPLLGTATAEATEPLEVRSVSATTAGATTTTIDVDAHGPQEIVSVQVFVYRYRTNERVATLDSFERVSGTATDGVWRSTDTVDLTGNFQILAKATDAAGGQDTVWGEVMNGVELVFSEFGISPDHVTPTTTRSRSRAA